MFDKLAGILDKYNIPYTKFKGGNYSINIAYLSKDDTWLVANDVVDLSKSVYNKNKKQKYLTLSKIYNHLSYYK